jgi:hypothetical protein
VLFGASATPTNARQAKIATHVAKPSGGWIVSSFERAIKITAGEYFAAV